MENSFFYDKTYNDINFKISDEYEYIEDFTIPLNYLIIEDEKIEEIDIGKIVENEKYFENIIPNYIKELIDITEVVNDVNKSMKKLWETWQW